MDLLLNIFDLVSKPERETLPDQIIPVIPPLDTNSSDASPWRWLMP